MVVERDKTGIVTQRTAEAATKAASAVRAAMERVGAAENEVTYWRHWQQRVDINTRPEQSVADAMPAANTAMAERQIRQAKELAAKEAAADAQNEQEGQGKERRKASFDVEVVVGVKKGLNLVNGLSSEECERLPVSIEALTRMSSKREDLRFGKYAKGSRKQIEMGTVHWYFFCARFNVPRFLMTNTIEGIRAATAQAETFVLHELANF